MLLFALAAILAAATFIGVVIFPGQKQLTRIPLLPYKVFGHNKQIFQLVSYPMKLTYSFAALLVIPTTACFAAEYEAFFDRPVSPAIELALTIDPPSLSTWS